MNGSKRRRKGRGVRIPTTVFVAVLVAVAIVASSYYYVQTTKTTSGGGAGITTVSTTGVSCNDQSIPQEGQQLEQQPGYAKIANGLCFNYLGHVNGTTSQGDAIYNFGYYNGTIFYPCGVSPWQIPQTVIQATVTPAGQSSFLSLSPSAIFSEFGPSGNCTVTPAVEVVAVKEVFSNTSSPVPELNLTVNAPIQPSHVTSLYAVLTLHGGDEVFNYVDITPANPLPQSINVVGVEAVKTGLSFYAGEEYPLQISGAESNGQTFNYIVHVQVANAPAR